jgi:hypothetical protein
MTLTKFRTRISKHDIYVYVNKLPSATSKGNKTVTPTASSEQLKQKSPK